jgi:hypothetical protein
LRRDCGHPDTGPAQLKVEDPDEVAEGRLAEAVRHARGRIGPKARDTCTIAPEPRCRMYGSTAWLSHSAALGWVHHDPQVLGRGVACLTGEKAADAVHQHLRGPTSPAIRSMRVLATA